MRGEVSTCADKDIFDSTFRTSSLFIVIKVCYNPATVSTSDQRCFNVVDPPLKRKPDPMSDFQRCTTVFKVEITLRCTIL